MSTSFVVRLLAIPALMCLCASSQASLTVYTTQASFLAATSAPGIDTFTGLNTTDTTPSPLSRSAGAYAYTASTSLDDFFGAGTAADPWLASSTAAVTITFNGFSNAAQAIGGNFFGSDVFGQYEDGSVTVTATDSDGALTQTLLNASTTSFLGFVSTDSLISLTVAPSQAASLWPTVDNLVIAQRSGSASVPEPASTALLLAGIGIIGWLARRPVPSAGARMPPA